jgi:glycosyltransferase involved in cell wall biosynthesis
MKMCEAFASLGHELYLIVPNKNEAYEKDIADVFKFYNVQNCFKIIKIPLSLPILNLFYFWPILIYNLIKINPSLVYGRYLPGTLLSAKLGFNVMFEIHYFLNNDSSDAKMLKSLISNKHFIKLITISEILRQDYINDGRVSKNKSMVAHDASSKFNLNKYPIQIGGRKEVFKVGYVGNLFKGKGMELISQLVHKVPEADFHIIGGYPQDILYWQELISASNIYFHGFIPQVQIGEYIDSIDICLLPNQKQVYTQGSNVVDIGKYTSPLKLFDYMAFAKPILASDLPVLREVLINGQNCLLCTYDDVNSWVSSLRRLFKDESLRIKISNNAFETFHQKHTWNIRAKLILEDEFI